MPALWEAEAEGSRVEAQLGSSQLYEIIYKYKGRGTQVSVKVLGRITNQKHLVPGCEEGLPFSSWKPLPLMAAVTIVFSLGAWEKHSSKVS